MIGQALILKHTEALSRAVAHLQYSETSQLQNQSQRFDSQDLYSLPCPPSRQYVGPEQISERLLRFLDMLHIVIVPQWMNPND